MRFIGQSKKWFDIPLNALSNVQQGGNKNEIALEFNKDEEVEDSAICEIKLFIPQQEEKKEKKAEEKDENKENQEEEKVIKTKGELLKEEIMKIAGIGSVSGAIAQIPEIQFMIPRGKFDMFFLKNSLKMNGQSHSYQIQNKNVAKIYLVPKAEGNGNLLIMKLRSPITQGSILYPNEMRHKRTRKTFGNRHATPACFSLLPATRITWYNTQESGQSGGTADTGDLKSPAEFPACGFESRLWHHP